jgi:branched-chain amino acid transport system permease protein
VTFCFAALLYKFVMGSSKTFGGEEGLFGVSGLMDTSRGNYYFSGILMLAMIFFLYFLSRSSFGLILRSIGENERASEGSGINTTFYKVTAFVISAFLAGVAGGMYCHAEMSVGPEQARDSLSGLVLMMAVVGGMGSITGPIMGAYLLTGLNESLRFIGELRLLIYSATVVLVVLFAPKGLIEITGRVKDLVLARMGWKAKAPDVKVKAYD